MVADKECKTVLFKARFAVFLNMFLHIPELFTCFKQLNDHTACTIILKDSINVILI